jgi:hypothetical protein
MKISFPPFRLTRRGSPSPSLFEWGVTGGRYTTRASRPLPACLSTRRGCPGGGGDPLGGRVR